MDEKDTPCCLCGAPGEGLYVFPNREVIVVCEPCGRNTEAQQRRAALHVVKPEADAP